MKVQFSICFRCARRVEVFSLARADALEMRSHANPRPWSETQVPSWIVPRSCTQRHTCSNGFDTLRRSWSG